MLLATLRARVSVTAATLITATAMATAAVALTAAPASATPTITPSVTATAAHAQVRLSTTRARAGSGAAILARHNTLVHKVLHEAQRQKGKPYVYGEDGPHGFDCSGLVRYVFLHSVHRSLPHNAAEQYHSLRHISRSQLMPGDLVFTDNGYISHVGIYDGHGYWWVAPHSGTHVQRQKIYSAHFVYARVLLLRHHLAHAS